jgi:hypothetical protein
MSERRPTRSPDAAARIVGDDAQAQTLVAIASALRRRAMEVTIGAAT